MAVEHKQDTTIKSSARPKSGLFNQSPFKMYYKEEENDPSMESPSDEERAAPEEEKEEFDLLNQSYGDEEVDMYWFSNNLTLK